MTEIKDLITDYVKGLEFVFDGIYRDALMEVVQQKTGVLFFGCTNGIFRLRRMSTF